MIYRYNILQNDNDPETAQMFAPVDEYLKLSKRFGFKAMRTKQIVKVIAWTVISVPLLVLTFRVLFQGDATGIVAGLIIMLFDAAVIYMIFFNKRHFGEEPDDNMLACERILEKDGIAQVYEDYKSAVEFTKVKFTGMNPIQSVIGKKYIFVKGDTLIRLRDIKETVLDVRRHMVKGSENIRYWFTVHAEDETGRRAVDLELLSSNEEKRQKRYEELCAVLEKAQKRTEHTERKR